MKLRFTSNCTRKQVLYRPLEECLFCLVVMLGGIIVGGVTFNAEGNLINNETFQCGKDVSLVCRTGPNPLSVVISVDNQVAGSCIFGVCSNGSSIPPTYVFTENYSMGIFTLSLKPARSSDGEKAFRCSAQGQDHTLTPTVAALPENVYIKANINSTEATVTATTGCVSPASDVEFVWQTIKVQNPLHVTNVSLAEQSVESDNSSCLPSAYCEAGGLSSSVHFILDDSVDESYVEVYITHKYVPTRIIGKTRLKETVRLRVDVPSPMCIEKLCLPCWLFIIILLSITAATIFIFAYLNVCCLPEHRRKWIHWNTSTTVASVILLVVHVSVTLAARFCGHADSCDDDKCLPCWVYCVILLVIISTSVFVIVIAKVCSGETMVGRLRVWEVFAIAVILLVAIAYVAVTLLARFCKVKTHSRGTNDINCVIYGVILACIFVIHVCVVSFVKGCCPKKRVVQTWEVIFITGLIILILVAVVFVVLSGYRRKYTDSLALAVSCWSIFLIVSGATFVFFLFLTLIYIFLEPLQEVKILSRNVVGNSMQAKVQWKCRLAQHKKFYVQLYLKSHKSTATELSYELIEKEIGLLQGTIAGLTLDSQYIAHLYTTMYNIPSLEKTVEFHTKGRPMAPRNIREDETLKTESSITVNWKAATSEINQQYIIKYKRTKPVKAGWTLTSEINKRQCTLYNLKPGTSYTIIVIAKNQIGLSEESKPLVVKTRAQVPQPPMDFQCKKVSQEEVSVSWKPSSEISKQKFRLSVSNSTNEEESSMCSEDEIWIAYDGRKTMEYTVKELEPGTEYVFEIVTVVGKRFSERSAIIFVTTEGSRNEPDSKLLMPSDKKTTSVFHLSTKQT